MSEFIDEAAIAAMKAIISNPKLYSELEEAAIKDQTALTVVIAENAFDFAEALVEEYKKRYRKDVKTY